MSAELREVQLEPTDAGVVDQLELLLERARKGDFAMLAAVAIERDGYPLFVRSDITNRTLMMGALARLHHWMLKRCDDD